MKNKMLVSAVCMALAAAAVAGCGGKKDASGGGSSKPVTLKMNVTTSENSVWHVAAKEFKKEVEEKTQYSVVEIKRLVGVQLESGMIVADYLRK